MKTIWVASCLACVGIFTCGCGTVFNLTSGDPDVYGGIQKDVTYIQTPHNATVSVTGIGRWMGAFPLLLVAADAGLSVVADTVTLPLVILMRQNEHDSDNEKNADVAKKKTSLDSAMTQNHLSRTPEPPESSGR
jgi:uncharacterized protein YceK